MGESLPPKREKKESRSFQSPGKTESKIDEQSTLERVSRVHRRADSKRENTRWFFYAHKKLIHHHHHHHLLAAPKIGPKRRTQIIARKARRATSRARPNRSRVAQKLLPRSFRARVEETIRPISPSPPTFRQKVRAYIFAKKAVYKFDAPLLSYCAR